MNPTRASAETSVPWTLGDVAKGIGLVALAAVLLLSVLLLASQLLSVSRAMFGLLLSAALEGVLLLAVWRYGPWRYGQSWKALGLGPTFNNGVPLALMVFVASVGFTVLYSWAMVALGFKDMTPPSIPSELFETYPSRITTFLLTVLLAPVAEESFFRGFLLPVCARRLGFLRGAAFTSLLFSISHVAAGLLIPAFVSGLMLAWLYRRTGSLWNCSLAHAAQNALAVVITVSLG